jgi:hypothetical protein
MPNSQPVKREFPRYDTNVSAILTSPTMRIGVRMLSVSAGGAMVRLDRLSAKVFEDDSFLIEITNIGRFSAGKKWRRDTDIGVKFDLSDNDRRRLAERLADRFGARPAAAHRSPVPSPPP